MRPIVVLALLSLSAWVSAQHATSTSPATRPTRPGATTRAATRPAAPVTTRPTTRAVDPLTTPESAVKHLFKLMGQNDVPAVRLILIDPPPTEELKTTVARASENLRRGATFEVIETKLEGSAAAVVYRALGPQGQVDVSHIVVLQRYDRWKVILSGYNPRRYTPLEREDLAAILHWTNQRLLELKSAVTQPGAATQPATQLAR